MSEPKGEWLWADVDGADLRTGVVFLRLRDGELPTVKVGDAARVFLRRFPVGDATHGKGPCAGTSRPKPDVTKPSDSACVESHAPQFPSGGQPDAETTPRYKVT